MKNIETDLTINNIINNNSNDKVIMVFVKGINCSVCHAIEDRVEKTFKNLYPTLDIHYILMEDNPLFRGQYLIFTVPTLLVFQNNKEIHRESRIIDFNRLDKLLKLVL